MGHGMLNQWKKIREREYARRQICAPAPGLIDEDNLKLNNYTLIYF